MFKKYLFLFLILSSFSYAENIYRLEAFGSSTYRQWNKDSQFNLDNRNFKSPTWTHSLEFRPDIQLGISEKHSVVLRSRHFLQRFETDFTSPDETKKTSDEDSDLSDLFFSSGWSDGFSTTIGLQNYQWGPAEIFSASNPFFHFENNQRSFFYKEKGRVLIRANWNPNPETTRWSVVGLHEPVNNQTPYWIAEKDFSRKSAVKVEYQFENPANAAAIVLGESENQPFVGEFFTWSPKEGFSIYADAKHRAGREYYKPKFNRLGYYEMLEADDSRLYTLAVLGLRWEGRIDARQEFILNEAGYSREEWNHAKASATTLSPGVLISAKRFAAPGLEFRTKAYSYTSLRIPDLGSSKNGSVGIRWLSSLILHTGALQLNYEYNWNDHTVISVEGIQFLGKKEGEFRIADNSQASVGFRWSY